jgi:cell division protein FtsZ
MAINSPLLDVSIHGAKGVLFSIAGGEDLTMFEIQDAAKVITESIDPQAKVIFGTIRDDKLKKNEVKITVIAAGFPEGNPIHAMAGGQSVTAGIGSSAVSGAKAIPFNAPAGKVTSPEPTSMKGRIFNSLTGSDTKEDKVKVEDKKDSLQNTKNDDDDDWGAVPAFLRRSKIK